MGNRIKVYTTFQATVTIAAGLAAGGHYLQIVPDRANPLVGAPSVVMGLTRLRIALTTATAGTFGLSPASVAGTPNATAVGRAVSNGNGGYGNAIGAPTDVGRLVTTWTVPATESAFYYAQDTLPGTLGAAIDWTWPEDDPLTGCSSGGLNALLKTTTPAFNGLGIILQNTGAGVGPGVIVTARWMEFNPNP